MKKDLRELAIIICTWGILALISWLSWNALVPEIFKGPKITYVSALSMIALVEVFVGILKRMFH